MQWVQRWERFLDVPGDHPFDRSSRERMDAGEQLVGDDTQ